MRSPLLSFVDGDTGSPSNLTVWGSFQETVPHKKSDPERHNSVGLSDCSSVGSSSASEAKSSVLNLIANDLRLGLPGSHLPERVPELELLDTTSPGEKPLFPVHAVKELDAIKGSKRGPSAAPNDFSSEKFLPYSPKENCSPLPAKMKNATSSSAAPCVASKKNGPQNNANCGRAAKVQVVGWPPIRSFRRNSLCTDSKNTRADGNPCTRFVKVRMDGAPYLRKVDLSVYSTYQELSSELQRMFGCFITAQWITEERNDKGVQIVVRCEDLLHGSEYVLCYEDKDDDWMLVGDVPWGMFVESCKKLRIMKGCDAIGFSVHNSILS